MDGGNLVALSGGNSSRVFVVNSGATLNLKRLTIQNGYSGPGDGGAIYSNGTLNVDSCKFLNNHTDPGYSGGAIVNYGPLTITNSCFAGLEIALRKKKTTLEAWF
jgi:hypothetical protein